MEFDGVCRILCLLGIGFLVDMCSCQRIVYKTLGPPQAKEIPDVYKKTMDFIEAEGYAGEMHVVTTEDGYILAMHRIVGRQSDYAFNGIEQPRRPVILIQHGLSARSDSWLLQGHRSLPYMLSDAGYDVWLGDTRGNGYSKTHVQLFANQSSYWDFSFHEQGFYDLPCMVDYMLSVSGQKKLIYIGHSRGTAMAFVLLSSRPEYNSKFHLVVAFAPVAYIKHAKSPVLKFLFRNLVPKQLMKMEKKIRLVILPGLSQRVVEFRKRACSPSAPTWVLCINLLFLVAGYNYDLFNLTRLPVVTTHFPDGGSMKEFLHFIQVAQSDKFRQYDYGEEGNLRYYRQPTPPEYLLERITAPVVLIHALNDFMVSVQDLDRLNYRLRNVVGRFVVPFEKFNHIDFIVGNHADTLVYEPTVKLIKNFMGNQDR